MPVELVSYAIQNPTALNLIFGQSHFIKTVEDLYEALAGSVPGLKFGLAFSEASGERLVRRAGSDDELVELATRNVLEIAAGHCFLILLREAFPINVLPAVKAVQEVCTIFCATANPVRVILADVGDGRAVLGVVDGFKPLGVESEQQVAEREALLRRFGYKLGTSGPA
ncbi:MAG TPA: adenosine-specific kinase [Thermomicrobiaceae bacterium]|nr:adenosine-specific kinase [Thermomicrobiaceae bacterium]